MKTKMSKLLSIVLVAALALSLAVAAIWDQPAQALTADEITAAQTTAATELADAQARADKAWNALQSLPTPEEVKAGEPLPTTCPYCGMKSVSWFVVTDSAETTTGSGKKHVYLAADVNFAGTESDAFITASSTNTCVFTNGYNITSTKKPAIFVSNSVNNIIAWSRTSRTEGGSLIRGYRTGNTSGSTVFSNGGTSKGTIHMFGGTYKKYDPNNETASHVISDHGNSGKYHMYEGTTIEAGTKGSAVNLSGKMSYYSITFAMYGGTITGGANRAAVSVGASSTKNASHYCKFTMYGGTVNGGAGQAAVESVTGADGKDCLITVYGGTINGNTADSSYAVKLSTAKTDFKMYGGTINGKSGNVGGPAIRTEVASKITIAGGNVNGTTTSATGGTIYIKAAATLNINGGTISGGNAPSAGNIYLNEGATVTMTGGIIENGIASGNADNESYGGNMYVYNSTFTMENGIIRGGSSAGSTEGRGGNLYITTGSAVEMNGGTVSDGYAREGGNIYVYSNATASFTMNGGLVDGGESVLSGGNILKGTSAIMTLNAGAVIQNGIAGRYGGNISIDGGTLTTSAEILNGTGRLGGGNINGAAGHVIVSGGTIANGWVSGAWDKDQQKYVANGGNWGGNIRCWNGQLTINDGVIYGGHRGVGNDAAEANNADSDNIGFKRDGSKTYTLAISGGTIVGDVGISNDPTVIVKLSGAPKVLKTYTYFDEETNQNVTVSANNNGLYLQEKDQVDISELTQDAMICVSGAADAVLTEPCDNVQELQKCFISYAKNRCVTVNANNSLVYSNHGTKKTITAAAATCEAGGYAVDALYCATCKKYYNAAHTAILAESDVVIAALGHDPVSHDAKAPTCTEIGWDAYETCSRCDYTTYVEKAALKHDYVGVETTAPTCEGKGVMTYTCANDASHTYTEEIPAAGHTIVLLTPEVKPTNCITPGNSAVYTCTVCGAYFSDAEGKNQQDSETPDILFPDGHQLTFVEASAATCEADGKMAHYLCSVCGGTYAENDDYATETIETVIPKLGHSYTNYIYNNDATYEADGTETATCDNGCGTTDTRIAEGTKIPGIAQIGDTKYPTLQAAIEAAQAGDTIVLLDDVTIAAEIATIYSNGQAYTGIKVAEGITIDGAGHTLTVTGAAGNTWSSAIYMTGGAVKNLTIAGGAKRGILVNCPTGDVTVENVSVSDALYALNTNSAGVNGPVKLTVTNSTLNGWTSVSNVSVAEATFENCKFGKSNRGEGLTDYAYFRPYCATTISGAETTFAEGFKVDANNADITIAAEVPAEQVAKLALEENCVLVENADGSRTICVKKDAAQIGETKYETLQEALAAAKAGETVKLLSNVDASSEIVLLMNGVKLDLGGKELKVNYLIATTGGSEIIDSANGEGIVMMAKKNLTLVNPECLPVWCEAEGGYRFSQVKAYIHEESKTADALVLWYWFEECALDAALKPELENAAENGIKVILRVEYTTNDGSAAKLSIVVPESKLAEYVQAGELSHFATTIRGLNDLGNATITVLATYGDIEIAGATYIYEAV